jgi:hypothetical protein
LIPKKLKDGFFELFEEGVVPGSQVRRRRELGREWHNLLGRNPSADKR